jgi:hypothetical protein
MQTEILKGYVPGGEDRTQWIFEGEDWLPEEQQVLIDLVTEHVHAVRQEHGWDVVNYFGFTKTKFNHVGSEIEYLYFCQRRNWRYNLMAFSATELAQKVRDGLNK